MVNKSLIVYVSKKGVTAENAKIIGDVLEKKHAHHVDIINLKEKSIMETGDYDNILVGYGVMSQMAYRKPIRFLKNNDFTNKNLAVFFSSLEAGDPKQHDKAIYKYVTKKLIDKLKLNLVSYEGFGGRAFKEDLSDPDKVKAWADNLGNKLSS